MLVEQEEVKLTVALWQVDDERWLAKKRLLRTNVNLCPCETEKNKHETTSGDTVQYVGHTKNTSSVRIYFGCPGLHFAHTSENGRLKRRTQTKTRPMRHLELTMATALKAPNSSFTDVNEVVEPSGENLEAAVKKSQQRAHREAQKAASRALLGESALSSSRQLATSKLLLWTT